MTKEKYLLQLFADGEGGGAADGAGGEHGAADAAQENTTGTATASTEQSVDRATEFERLIKGDYKDEFEKRTQKIIDKRFKQSKETENKFNQTKPLLDLLARKYGKDADDLEGLFEAAHADDSLYEDAAYQAGLSVEEYKAKLDADRYKQELDSIKQEHSQREQREQQFRQWMRESEQLKQRYPDFDFRREAANGDFVQMLNAGVSVKAAYEAAHFDELVNASVVRAAQTAKMQTANAIRANGQRPIENGLSAQASAHQTVDLNSLTDNDIADIMERVGRGEKITFR